MAKPSTPRFHSVQQIKDALGVSRKTVDRLIAKGELRVHRIGRSVRISEEDYRAFVALRRG